MKSAVVTGANGFVGRALVEELLRHKVRVIAIVHSISSVNKLSGDVHYIECPIERYLQIRSELMEHNPDVFYHLAWIGTSGPTRADEKKQLSNVQGTCDAVRLAASVGCRRFVFASSIMEYEVEAEIKRMYNPGINSIYSVAKTTADHMARIIATDQHIEYISALISNIYGPGEKSSRLINYSIRKLIAGERLSLSPGEQLYDFIYISDAVKMFAAIGEKGKPSKIYYLGNRVVYPLKEFMKELRDIVAPHADLGFGDLPYNGISLTYNEFDKELLYRDTGVMAVVPFSEGIKITSDWIKEETISE